MATTAIWPIRGRLDHVMTYTENPDKTANPKWKQADLQALSDVVEYAMDEAKMRGALSELGHIVGENQCHRQYFTSGVNCDPATARDAMNMTKRRFGKEGGIVAFHGYQSFLPGEVTPEQAHLIGLELAQRLWGERFEVVVSTHLNTGVIHNHFVLNSVSCVDGLRYYDNKKTYAQMRCASDELCRAHMLSVITQQNGHSAHYKEWMAEHAAERDAHTGTRELSAIQGHMEKPQGALFLLFTQTPTGAAVKGPCAFCVTGGFTELIHAQRASPIPAPL